MIENIFNVLTDLLYENSLFALSSSFLWGILSIILSPCHLTTIPLIIAYISKKSNLSVSKSMLISTIFAIGILASIAVIGGITLLLGRIMGDISEYGNYIIALVFFFFGLYLLDVFRIPWSGLKPKENSYQGWFSSFLMGFIFGIGLGPCTFGFMAPVLGVVFEVSASDPALAGGLITAFAIGHCFVIALAGSFIKVVQKYLHWTESSKATTIIRRICGALVILGGLYLLLKNFI
jgi:cytochrome c-type biogenesis protein